VDACNTFRTSPSDERCHAELAANTVHTFANTVDCSLFTTAVHTFAERPAAEPAAVNV